MGQQRRNGRVGQPEVNVHLCPSEQEQTSVEASACAVMHPGYPCEAGGLDGGLTKHDVDSLSLILTQATAFSSLQRRCCSGVVRAASTMYVCYPILALCIAVAPLLVLVLGPRRAEHLLSTPPAMASARATQGFTGRTHIGC